MEHTTVVGGGYAGVMAANRLAVRGHAITLVTDKPYFVERIRLHEVAGGGRPNAEVRFEQILHPSVQIVGERVSRILPDSRTLQLATGRQLSYDRLVYAVGSGAPQSSWPHTIAHEAGARALRDELAAQPQSEVVVVGAGLTGVEVAASLACAGRRVTVLTSSTMDQRAGDKAAVRRLRRLGVTVRCGIDHEPEVPTAGIVVGATGFAVPGLAADSGLPVATDGRLLVDATLQVPGVDGILGAGDAVQITDSIAGHLRPACATAMAMGAHAADVLEMLTHDREPARFSLGYVAQCVDLGAGIGRVQFVRADDSERPFALTGRIGGSAKELVSRLTLRWLARERGRAGRYSWATGPSVRIPASMAA